MNKFILILAAAGITLSGVLPAFGQARQRTTIDAPLPRSMAPDRVYLSEQFLRGLQNAEVLRNVEPSVTTEEAQILRDALAQQESLGPETSARALAAQVREGNGEQRGSSPMMHFVVAALFQQATNFEEARNWYERAINAKSDFLRAHKNLGLLLAQTEQYDAAETHLKRAIELGDRDALTLGLLGFIYQASERYVAAEAAYREAMVYAPNQRNWRMNLASVLITQQRFEEANSLLQQLIAEDPNNSRLWLLQANALINTERPRDAAINYEIVREMGEADVNVLAQLGDIYLNLNILDLAADAYIQSVAEATSGRISPSKPISAARTLMQFGDLNNSEALMNAVRDRYGDELSEEDDIDLLTLQSQIQIARGNEAEAAETLENLIERDPTAGDAIITLANYYANNFEQGTTERQRAKDLYKQAADLSGDGNITAVANLRWGMLLVREREYREALDKLRLSNSLDPASYKENYIRQVERLLGASI